MIGMAFRLFLLLSSVQQLGLLNGEFYNISYWFLLTSRTPVVFDHEAPSACTAWPLPPALRHPCRLAIDVAVEPADPALPGTSRTPCSHVPAPGGVRIVVTRMIESYQL